MQHATKFMGKCVHPNTVAGLPDENFNKKPNIAKKRPEKGQTDCLKARKKPIFVFDIALPLLQKTSKLQEYH